MLRYDTILCDTIWALFKYDVLFANPASWELKALDPKPQPQTESQVEPAPHTTGTKSLERAPIKNMGVSENLGGTLFWAPYKKDPTI